MLNRGFPDFLPKLQLQSRHIASVPEIRSDAKVKLDGYIRVAHPRLTPSLFLLLPPLSRGHLHPHSPPPSHLKSSLPSSTLCSPPAAIHYLSSDHQARGPASCSLRKNQTALSSLKSWASVRGPHSYLRVAGLVGGHRVSRIPSACKIVFKNSFQTKIVQSFTILWIQEIGESP